ncbi:MAG: DUF2490 domain-containing protein [Planctomycetes bacterium]|nr:DUF2490 domain-containing protein [Planctomycetota bacterium]
MAIPRLPSVPLALAAAAILSLSRPVQAQLDHDGGVWTALNSQGKLDSLAPELSRVRWWLDVHVRQRDEGERFETSIVRPGVGYALTDTMTAWVGHAWVVNDLPGKDPFGEHRIWQQFSWNPDVGRLAPSLADLKLSSRTRLEERFVEDHGTVGWRLRQMFKATYPLRQDHRVFASVWDELFWDLNDATWGTHGTQSTGFSQNRGFAGIGFQLDEGRHWSVEVGYLNQWVDRQGRDDRMNHVVAVWLFANF